MALRGIIGQSTLGSLELGAGVGAAQNAFTLNAAALTHTITLAAATLTESNPSLSANALTHTISLQSASLKFSGASGGGHGGGKFRTISNLSN